MATSNPVWSCSRKQTQRTTEEALDDCQMMGLSLTQATHIEAEDKGQWRK